MKLLDSALIRGLGELYDYRLIQVQRFYQRHIQATGTDFETFARQLIPSWVNENLVEVVSLGKQLGLVLGKEGVEKVKRDRQLQDNVLGEKGTIRCRFHYKASELKPTKAKLVKYFQYSEYLFELFQLLDELKLNYRYYDRLHTRGHLRIGESDGVLVVEGEVELYLYWNLSQYKDAKQQCKRGFKTFFESHPNYENERTMYAVFLHQEEFGWLAYRKAHYEWLEPFLSRSFNALALTPIEFKTWVKTTLKPRLSASDPLLAQLIKVATHESIPLHFNFSASPKEIRDYHTRFTLPNGRFLFTIDARDFSSAALKQMKWHADNSYILRQLHSGVKYDAIALVIVEDVEKLQEWLYQEELVGEHFIFFTTLNHLDCYPLLEACWRYQSNGQIIHLKQALT